MVESTTFLEIYRDRDCVRRFHAVTTHSEYHVRNAMDVVNDDMGGLGFTHLLEQYVGASAEDLAKDLGVSWEFADTIRHVAGMA